MCATGAEHFRENDNENGRNFAKINYFRMSFENFAKVILRKSKTLISTQRNVTQTRFFAHFPQQILWNTPRQYTIWATPQNKFRVKEQYPEYRNKKICAWKLCLRS